MTDSPSYDPLLYRGAATYYTRGRPPYSRLLAATLAAELELDGSGRLLDAGCGPGVLALELADRFRETIGLDPDQGMLDEAARRASERDVTTVRWVRGRAEDLPHLGLGRFTLVTFGQSFHWTDRARVAELVHDALEPGGALALIHHDITNRPPPPGPPHPPIPHEAITALLDRYLGPQRRAGGGLRALSSERHESVLARTRFGPPRRITIEGRADIVQDVEGVLANYFSASFAAPHLFGDRRQAFESEMRSLLAEHSERGLFWDWPGNTEILLARKPA